MVRDDRRDANGDGQKKFSAPSIALPKGGGAIRGIGENFAANRVTGTGAMSVPIATSPGRSNFGPQLSLSYDSGAGNGPFGFGWALSLPQITRKTDRGLPQYQDAEESDVYILSGAEDLVPAAVEENGAWVRETQPDRAIGPDTYTVQRYRPRVEGLFARIERWARHDDGDVHWRSISRDNVLTVYGKDANARIADPSDPERVFSWLICESRDDKGNAVVYEYKAEDGTGADLARAHERNRGDRNDPRRAVNRYPKRIRYGNQSTLLEGSGRRAPLLNAAQLQNADWMFEVVFDYGEHAADAPKPDDAGAWTYRSDPFSSYRAGFEVRTSRLCQRVLMFHHFPGEPGVGTDCLVRSTDFKYSHEQNPGDTRNPRYTFLLSVTQSGYKRDSGAYRKRTLPPVEYQYTQPIVQDTVHELDSESLENLPIGVDGAAYQWIDLHGEGIPGILTEQAGGWFYKRNVSPISKRSVEFAPLERVALTPNRDLADGQAQFMDLAGDGQPDLVALEGPVPGMYEHDTEEGWQGFRPFKSRLSRDSRDPNVKFVDLDGDGHADVLISEDDAFLWHPSLAEEGFGPARRVQQPLDEENGARLVFADGTASIFLADLDGDGLTDLVRIRNGDICYWPNLGYGHFGAKITMDGAPHFDHPDQFDHKRIRLTDIDGTGTIDIIYLHRDGVRLYFNQSGNSWGEAQHLNVCPRVDDLTSIVPTDLFGNGTACLVWSSPLPGDAHRPMRYVDLMGGQKPHLLVRSVNNLGAETMVSYAASTKFYLTDKAAGKPWITKLPFPVHCVEKVTVTDKWRKTVSSTTYSYHHGYFDGAEREFRGFGRVEQVDVESFGEFAQGNSASPYITSDKTLYQPPVKTVTWYHTGALSERERVLSHFAHEYFPRWWERLHPPTDLLGGFQENVLPEPDLRALDLSADEWREALRACKGMMLRQEVYELDVDALERGEHRPLKLFTTAYHNCHIRRLQAKVANRHAVFLVAESEAITYHYELDLRADSLRPDPRIGHTLNLSLDEYGNVLQSVTVAYPRLTQFENDALPPEAVALIRNVQRERHLAYSETRYTTDVTEPDDYRLRMSCEVVSYELTGIGPEDADDQLTPDARDNRYFTLDELRGLRLSLVHQTAGTSVPEIAYHQLADAATPQKRLVDHARVLFFNDDSAILDAPLPFGQSGRLGLPYETLKLALTGELLDTIFGNKLTTEGRGLLGNASVSGYLSGATLDARFPGSGTDGQYWIRSGIAGFAPDAAHHFYLPERFTDPFGSVTTLEYDPRDLFVASTTDALGNTTRVEHFDFRVLSPSEMRDINGNLSEVFFDVLGLPSAMAVKGKGTEGDNLAGFDGAQANPDTAELATFFGQADLDETQARAWLANASERHVYYFGESFDTDGNIVWGAHPACACGIVRETHESQLAPGEQSALQTAFEYSDGMGSVLVKKVQAEPEAVGQRMRWVANGKTIVNNKGKPVKQYEPYFSPSGHRFEEPIEVGVTPVLYYDAVGRLFRTEMPDGTLSRVEFSPWFARSFDPNDAVRESQWYEDRNPSHPGEPLPRDITGRLLVTENQRAAWLAAQHADTPALTILDSLGRDVIGIAHNRVRDPSGSHVFGGERWRDEYHLTFTRLDAEGKPLWVRDARGNLVMQYITPPVPDNQPDNPVSGFAPCYDICGNLLFQHSMDAGDRWMLNDAAGNPMLAWNSRGHAFRNEYDELHRSVAVFVTGVDPLDADHEVQFEHVVYGDSRNNGLSDGQKNALNLRGKPYKHHDTAGVVINMGRDPITGGDEGFDFKGNLIRSRRQLVQDYKSTPDWSQGAALESETFSSATRFDALNRPIQLVPPHSDRPGARLNVIRPGYNEANLLERVQLWLEQTSEPTTLLVANTATQNVVGSIDYDPKGQRTHIRYGNGVSTTYEYDALTFRLARLVTDRGSSFADDWPQPPDPPTGGVQNLSYFYDPVGNITRIHDDAQHTIFFSGQRVEPSTDYVYDSIDRLIAATGREHIGQHASPQVDHDDSPRMNQPLPTDSAAVRNYTESYNYDPVGNILQMIHQADAAGSWTRRYDYEAMNNRLRATSLPGDAGAVFSANYQYDVHGNMTRMPHLPLMRWDFRDRLQATAQQVVNAGAPETTWYVYDARGQRVRKVTERQAAAGVTPTRMKERTYLGGFEIYREYDGAGNDVTLERETLHVRDDKQGVALIEIGTLDVASPLTTDAPLIRYQFGNHLGSASLELDHEGRMISYEEYHPYGSTSYQAGRTAEVSLKRYRYTGMERDDESGLSYHAARYYAPWLARWMSTDPAELRSASSSYEYSRSSPARFIDRDGRQPTEDDWSRAVKIRQLEAEVEQKQRGTRQHRYAYERLETFKDTGVDPGPRLNYEGGHSIVNTELPIVVGLAVAGMGVAGAFPRVARIIFGLTAAINAGEAVTGKSAGALNPMRLIFLDWEIGRNIGTVERVMAGVGAVLGFWGATRPSTKVVPPVRDTKPGSLEIQGDPSSFSRSELLSARWRVEEGHQVILRTPPRRGAVRGKGTSDLVVDGVPEDVITPRSTNPRSVAPGVADKGDQASSVLVDVSETSVTREALGGPSGLMKEVRGQIGRPWEGITAIEIIDTRILGVIDAFKKLSGR